MSDENFWLNGDACIVVPTVSGIAVYRNKDDNIVIRQQSYLGDEDDIVVIPRKFAAAVAKAIKDELKKASSGE